MRPARHAAWWPGYARGLRRRFDRSPATWDRDAVGGRSASGVHFTVMVIFLDITGG